MARWRRAENVRLIFTVRKAVVTSGCTLSVERWGQ